MAKFAKVMLSESAADAIIRSAICGYKAPFKEERLGILMGNVRSGVCKIEMAKPYNGGIRTRTSIDVDSDSIERAIRRLMSKHRRQFLGLYHTHPEVANNISSALSADDKEPICDTYTHFVEIVAGIWVSDCPVRPSDYYCQARCGEFRIRIAAYRFGGRYSIVPVGVMSR